VDLEPAEAPGPLGYRVQGLKLSDRRSLGVGTKRIAVTIGFDLDGIEISDEEFESLQRSATEPVPTDVGHEEPEDAVIATDPSVIDPEVLNALVHHFQKSEEPIRPEKAAEDTGYSVDTVQRSLSRLLRTGRIVGVTVEEVDWPLLVTSVNP